VLSVQQGASNAKGKLNRLTGTMDNVRQAQVAMGKKLPKRRVGSGGAEGYSCHPELTTRGSVPIERREEGEGQCARTIQKDVALS